MRKLTIAATATAMILSLGTGAASADGNRGWNSRSHDHRSERHANVRHRAPAVEVVRVGVHRRYVHERIPLRRLLGLDGEYRGYRIQSVTVKVRPNRTRARLALLADGHVVDRAPARHTRRVELKPDDNLTLGRDLNRLQLAVRGSAYIDSIQVKLRAPRHDQRRRHARRTTHDHRHQTPDLAEQVVRVILDQIEVADGRY